MLNLTVAIPSYNKEKYIDRCIKSALSNKDDITKIIVVDNQSTDTTLALTKNYAPDVSWHQNETNLGMARNWNKCIELCDTEWLLILHADDELVPGAIKLYEQFIQKYPTVGIIHANSFSIIEGDESTKTFTKKNQKEFWHAGLEGMKCHYGVCSSVMVKKVVYDKLGYFIESLSSDAEMWSRIASKYDVGFIDEPTVIYHISKTSTGYESYIKRSIAAIKKDWDFLNENIAKNYPTEESRWAFIKKSKKGSSYGFFTVAKANIKAGNFLKALHALYLIIFEYNGSFLLVTMIMDMVKSQAAKLKKKIFR